MKRLYVQFIAVIAFLLTGLQVDAQLRTPAPSPGATLTQAVGLTDVTIEYSRPAVKGRKIFAADGLVPFGQTWRTGANSATKITFSEDVKLGGQEVKKGSYAILTVPNAKEWKFMLYPYESSNFGTYVDKTPAVSFTVPSMTWDNNVESMLFLIDNITNSSANILFFWEKTGVSIPLEVYTAKQVSAAFDRMMAGPSNAEYFAMGQYLHETGGDLNKALEYVRKATTAANPGFWQVYREALILGDLGRTDEAIKTAEKSKSMAQAANNNDYVRLNDAAIAKWKEKKLK